MPSLDEMYVDLQRADSMGDTELARRIADGIRQTQGAQQAATETTPTQAALISLGDYFNRLKMGGQQLARSVGLPSGNLTQAEAALPSSNAAMEQLRQAHPVSTFVGELPLTMAARTPLGMAAMGALEYGTPEEKAARAGAGYAGGKAGELLGRLGGRVISPLVGKGQEAIAATKDVLAQYGMSGLPGQVTGSLPMKWMESTLAHLPGGGAIRAEQEAQQAALNRGALSTMGAAGESVTPEAVTAAKAAIGPKFESLAEKATVAIPEEVGLQLKAIEDNHMRLLSSDQRKIVSQYVDDILAHGENGMPGDVYQRTRSRLAARAAGTTDSELKAALRGIQKTLDDAFLQSAPADVAAEVLKARGQWRAAKTIEKLATPEGNVSPARVATATAGMPGDLGNLAELGMRMKGLPSSGTMERLAYQGLLSGGIGAGVGAATGDWEQALKYGGGSLLAPYAASRLITSAPGRAWLTNALMTPEKRKLLRYAGQVPGGLLGLDAYQ